MLALLALAGSATCTDPEPAANGLKVEVLSVPEGCTTKSKNGDMLTMHYTGTLDNGNKFDSRYDTWSLIKARAYVVFLTLFPATATRTSPNLKLF